MHDETGDTAFEETITVPGESCSDVVDGVERGDVFPEAGTYTVAVSVDGYDPRNAQVEIPERDIDDNSDNVAITIEETEISIG